MIEDSAGGVGGAVTTKRIRTIELEPAIWLAPGRRSGFSCVMGTRVPTFSVPSLYLVEGPGFTIERAAREYALTRAEGLVSCWYETAHGGRHYRKLWLQWVSDNFEAMFHGRWDDVPDPPKEPKP